MDALRECYRCRVSRPLSMFYIELEARQSAKSGRKKVQCCRLCKREEAAERQRPRREIVNAAKSAGCTDCGLVNIDHPEIFDFDHLPGEPKLANIATLMTRGTLDDLREEISKCEVVCANCHRIRSKSREYATFGTTQRRFAND